MLNAGAVIELRERLVSRVQQLRACWSDLTRFHRAWFAATQFKLIAANCEARLAARSYALVEFVAE